MRCTKPSLIGPSIVEADRVQIYRVPDARPKREPPLRILLEEVLVAGSHKQGAAVFPFDPRAHALGIVARMKRIDRQEQAVRFVERHRYPDSHTEKYRER